MSAFVERRFPVYVNFLVEADTCDGSYRDALETYARTVMISPVHLSASDDRRPAWLGDDVPVATVGKGAISFREHATPPDLAGSSEAVIAELPEINDQTGTVVFRDDTPFLEAIHLRNDDLNSMLATLAALPDDAPRHVLIRISERDFASASLQRAVRRTTKKRWRAIKWMGFEIMLRTNRIARDGPQAAQKTDRELRDKNVATYDKHRDTRFWDILTQHERRELDLTRQDRVIDLGSGIGREIIPFSKECGWSLALDFSHGSLVELRHREALPAVQASITDVPVADQSFDKALCCEVLQHLPTDAMRRASVAEALRVLRPGGTFVLVVYSWNGFQVKFKYDKEGYFKGVLFYHAFERDELHELLAGAGFTDVRVRPIGYFWRRFNKAPRVFTVLDRILSPLGAFDWLARWYIAVGRRPS